MKKLLTILGSVGLVATTSAAVIACGDKSQQKAPDTKPTEETRKEDKEEPKKDDEKTEDKEKKDQIDFSKVEKQIIGNFSPNNKTVPQSDIKKKLAELLKVKESELTNLNVNYEENTGKVTLPRFKKTLEFKFTTKYELGEFEQKNKAVPQSDIKKKLAELLKVKESELTNLNVNYEENTGSVRAKDYPKPFEFKFSVKEENKNK
ncbi:lipoprotein [Mycoplasma mycoides subsp. capri]|uniref:lipoprotein n=1 Tax=Mycoplasma mycoides TaxID=2102 RepID=UPI002240D04A|nr:lipoprotein [Mycoplasma mycoides]QVJ96311.1 lipoprotein [Mycoplasma mycoides subsp. capri]QVJ97210.1 lipoprotein [Mycoplasma mycoides subsp. capri]QVK00193.1 lipoprotein [Mycoplasma mycoides subsp. capri]QVK01076.1 lipoprotein [Mycoplasma mycoides subsp. capri]